MQGPAGPGWGLMGMSPGTLPDNPLGGVPGRMELTGWPPGRGLTPKSLAQVAELVMHKPGFFPVT